MPCDVARVLRGGSWNNNPQNLRSANRNRNTPDNRNNNLGLRLASTACARAPLRDERKDGVQGLSRGIGARAVSRACFGWCLLAAGADSC